MVIYNKCTLFKYKYCYFIYFIKLYKLYTFRILFLTKERKKRKILVVDDKLANSLASSSTTLENPNPNLHSLEDDEPKEGRSWEGQTIHLSHRRSS